ncbi:unnamed protein product [Allacma fusca]|uniref:diacylglycerol O-acyltransferase n=1 Tax=Allacma fusca TaxID=39272 RepID=A0A8J2JIW6_9HEXA|nr:unnamed protein product [Allacma fusca]
MKIIFKAFYISASFLFLITTAVFFVPWRYFIYLIAKVFRPELKCFATGLTRLFCSTNQWGDILPANAISVLTVEGHLELDSFRNLFHQRVLCKRDQKGKLIFEKFYEIITFFMGYPFWTRETNFDITDHIAAYDYHLDGISHFDESHLKAYLSRVMSDSWNAERSYWNITLVHGYTGKTNSLIIIKWQHALADGFSMKRFLEALCCSEMIAEALPEMQFPSRSARLRNLISEFYPRLEAFTETTKAIIRFPYDSARFKAGISRHEKRLWQKCVTVKEDEYHMTFTKPFSVKAIKSVQVKFGVGFQTVLFTAVSAALEKVLDQCKLPMTKMLLADCPKPLMSQNEGLTNSFYFGNICAPLEATLAEDRLLRTEQSFRSHRISKTSVGMYYMLEIAALLPGSLPWMCIGFMGQFVHIVFTSFPYFGEMVLGGYSVSDMITLFGSPHPSADFKVAVSGSPNQVRFGLSLRKSVNSLPPGTAWQKSTLVIGHRGGLGVDELRYGALNLDSNLHS